MKQKMLLLLGLVFVGGLAAQTDTIQFDQARNDSAFIDVGGGVKASTFEVKGRLKSLVFLVFIGEGNPVVEFITPSGQTRGLDSPDLAVQRLEWGVMAAIAEPQVGLWTLRLLQTLGEGSYQVKTYSIPAVPTLALTTPSFEKEPWSGPISIAAQTQPDQVGQTVAFTITEVTNTNQSLLAGTTAVAADGTARLTLDPEEIPAGEYQVVAALDQGANPSVTAKAPGTLRRPELPLLGPVTPLVAIVEQPDTLVVTFANPYGRRQAQFRLHVKPVAGTEAVYDLGMQTRLRLPGFDPGAADVWVTGIDGQQREGQAANPVRVQFGATPPTPPTLTLIAAEQTVTLPPGSTSIRFALSAPPTTPAAAVAYVQVGVGDLPRGLVVQPAQAQWVLPADAGRLDLVVSRDASTLPGVYRVPLTFSTVGQPQNAVAATLMVVCPEILPVITSTTPSSWLQGEAPTVEIFGENFGLGTQVFFGDEEVAVVSYSPTLLKVAAPATLYGGPHLLKIVEPSGAVVTTTVTVLAPRYTILAYKSVSKVRPGATARYWLGLRGENGFNGDASFHILNLPSGWSATIDPPTATANAEVTISVTVPAAAAPGTTDLIVNTSEGGLASLRTIVADAVADPFISSLGSYSELAGGTFVVRGYGFGAVSGQIRVDDQTWTVVSWTDDRIEARVPVGAQTGLLRVKTSAGTLSNGITFGVKDYGFAFHTNQTEFSVQPGEIKTIDLQIAGYRQPVTLAAEADPLFVVALSRSEVTPLGLTQLTVNVDKTITEGIYPVTVTGSSGLFQSLITLKLKVGPTLEWQNLALPTAVALTPYSVKLLAKNAAGALTFSVQNGTLPHGLSLVSDEIRGQATEKGSFRVVLEARDSAGHSALQEFVLLVQEAAWSREGRDESRSFASEVNAPADDRVLWTSAATGASRLLSSGGLVLAGADDHWQVIYGAKGSFLYRLDGRFRQPQIDQGRWFIIDETNTLQARDLGFGALAWSRSEVTEIWVKPGVVLAQSHDEVLVIDALLGTLKAAIPADLSGILVGWKGELHRLVQNRLEQWNDASGWTTVYRAQAPLILAQGDPSELTLQDATGQVLAWDGLAARPLWKGPLHHLAVGTALYFVDTGESLQSRDRATGTLVRQLGTGGYDQLMASRTKIFGLKSNLLTAINQTTGGVIWQAPAIEAILAEDKLYALGPQGRVSAYSAPDNVKPPVSSLVAVPGSDSESGWYRTRPRVAIDAYDPETYVVSSVWKIDQGDWQTVQPVVLEEGVHSLVWHSTDSHGLQEPDGLAVLQVDSVAPTTAIRFSVTPLPHLAPDGGLGFGGPVQVTLAAQDATSGLAGIRYRLDDGLWQAYDTPLTFSRFTRHQVEFHAFDRAGNQEAVQTQVFWIDASDPRVESDIVERDTSHFVYLSATDMGTGVDRIEYQLNSGALQTYQDVIPFLTTGQWTVTFRAVDRSGRTSSWKSIRVTNQGPNATNQVGNIEYAPGVKGREIENFVRVGSPIFAGSNEKFLALPNELVDAFYLRHRDTDGKLAVTPLVTITFRGAATVYYLKESDSKANLTGWTQGDLIPSGVLTKKYFAGGLRVWTKTVVGGEKLAIPGSALNHAGGDLVFIQPRWFGVVITQPVPRDRVEWSDEITFQAYTGSVGSTVTWTAKIRGNWKTLGTGNPLKTALPAEIAGNHLEVVATAKLGTQTAVDQTQYQFLHPERLSIAEPSTARPWKAGVSLQPVVLWRNKNGDLDAPPPLVWKVFQGATLVYQGESPLPALPLGSYRLTAATITAQPVVAESSFTVLPQWPKRLWLASDRATAAWSDPSAEGFIGLPMLDTRRATLGGTKTPLATALFNGAEYQWGLSTGTYQASIAVGPLHAWEVHTVYLGDRSVNVMSKEEGQMVKVTFVVKTSAPRLVLKGSWGLPVYALTLTRIDTGEPSTKVETGLTSLGEWK